MACRIKNTSPHTLHIDLRSGETLHLPAGSMSRALREEDLYGNPYFAEWEASGLAERVEARMVEVVAEEQAEAKEKRPPVAETILTELERVHGVGRALATSLVARGITSIAELAEQKAGELSAIPGVGETSAKDILKSARALRRKSGDRETGVSEKTSKRETKDE